MRNRINRARLNWVGVNGAFINRTRINWAGDTSGGAGEGDYELIPNCWMLETPEGSAWLWEDGTPMLLESTPSLRKRIKTK